MTLGKAGVELAGRDALRASAKVVTFSDQGMVRGLSSGKGCQ